MCSVPSTPSTRFPAVSLVLLLSVLALAGCNRDPNIAKKRYLDRGNQYFNKGKFKEASIMYRNALRNDLRYGPAHYKLGLADIRLGQVAPAVQELRRAIELLPPDEPDHWDAIVKLSEIYVAASPNKQSLEETETYVTQLLKRDHDSFDGHKLAGDLNYIRAANALRTGQKVEARKLHEQAIVEYRRADSIKPGQIAIEIQLARVLAAVGDVAAAEQLYRKVIGQDNKLETAYTELYRLFLLTGKPDDAERVLKLAFQNNPQQYGYLTLLASYYYSRQRLDDVVKVLDQIRSNAKSFPNAYLTVGDFYLRLRNYDAALKEFRDGIAKDAKQRPAYQKRIVDVLFQQGKRAEASQVNAEILKADPNDVDARNVAATLLLEQGDAGRAITELQAVLARSPHNAVTHFTLGRAQEARGDWERARQEFQKAVEIRPDYVAAGLSLAQLQLRQREWETALRTAGQILAVDQTNLNARLIQTAAFMGEGRFQDSRASLEQLQQSYPASADIQYQLGLVNLAGKRFKEAEDAFHRSYELNPANLRGLMGVVEAYRAQNKGDRAIPLLQAEAAKAPNRPDFHLAIAAAAILMGKFDVAIAQYQSVLSLPGQDARARAGIYLRLGETYRRKGDLSNAVPALEQARAVLPDNPVVLNTLALALDGAGRKPEARKAYEAAIQADPKNGVALNNLAFLMADSGGDLNQALTLAQKAKQLLPNVTEVSDTVGMIYLKKNLSEDALDIFKTLVAKEPNMPTYHYHLAMALSQKGDKSKALQELQHALRDNPSREEKEKIQQLMNRLG